LGGHHDNRLGRARVGAWTAAVIVCFMKYELLGDATPDQSVPC
jgi:hypothetical protein